MTTRHHGVIRPLTSRVVRRNLVLAVRAWHRHAQRYEGFLAENIARRAPRPSRRANQAYLASAYVQWLWFFNATNAGENSESMHQWGHRYLNRTRQRAEELDPAVASPEPIGVKNIPKTNGGVRTVYSYGPYMRARQRIVERIVSKLWRNDLQVQRQFRSGVHDVVREVRQALDTGQYLACAVLDVRRCFSSINDDFLYDYLPLPEEVIANTVLARPRDRGTATNRLLYGANAERDRENERVLRHRIVAGSRPGTGQQGLPQGSACSPIIAYHLLEMAIRRDGPIEACFQWGDDILVLGRTMEELRAKVIALQTALERSPAGPFLVGRCQMAQLPTAGFDFLRLSFSRGRNGRTAVLTSAEAVDRFRAKAESHADDELRSGARDIYRAVNYMRAWRDASAADDAANIYFSVFHEICDWHELDL